MIDLLPVPKDRFLCPCGAGELTVDGFNLPGMMPMARTHCRKCHRNYLAHLHVGFCSTGDFIVDEDSGIAQSTVQHDWYRDFAVTAVQSRGMSPDPVRRAVKRPLGSDVLLLNCLDPIYGHCLHRLFSLDAYRQHGFTGSVLAIVPHFLAWLVPDDVDEVWIVDTPLRQCHLANATIADLTDRLMQRVDRLRYADMAYNHQVDIALYTGVEPFAVVGHESVSPPRLTLNWREDRCWTIRGEQKEPSVAVGQQLRLFALLLETLREHVPDLDATVTGYGRTGQFPSWVEDLRIYAHDAAMERRWAQRYAVSHLSFGVHGSNTILPAALSLGAIEIVETRFWPHILVTWEWANRMSATDALARYRQLAASTSVSDVVSIALMQLRRMQGAAAHGLIAKLSASEPASSIMFRHAGAFRYPSQIICRDENGNPF